MWVLSINVPIRKKAGNLFNDPHIYIYIGRKKSQLWLYIGNYWFFLNKFCPRSYLKENVIFTNQFYFKPLKLRRNNIIMKEKFLKNSKIIIITIFTTFHWIFFIIALFFCVSLFVIWYQPRQIIWTQSHCINYLYQMQKLYSSLVSSISILHK